jgi:hypothetical protein
MGIPKYLENKIKSIFHCCIEPLVAQFSASLTPNSPTFILSRPNEELFVFGGPNNDQAIVGMADYANVGTPVLTGRQYGGDDVYEARFEVPLTTTGGSAALLSGINRIFEADLVFLEDSTGSSYYLNGTINTLCDATVVLNSGNLTLDWTTAHTADDVYVYVRYTLV